MWRVLLSPLPCLACPYPAGVVASILPSLGALWCKLCRPCRRRQHTSSREPPTRRLRPSNTWGHYSYRGSLSWFFPERPHGALSDPTCHIFRGLSPQGLVGGKAHHVSSQLHRADRPTGGAFHGMRCDRPQAPWVHIDGPGKGAFGWEGHRRYAADRIARWRPPADTSAPLGWGRGARVRLRCAKPYRSRWAGKTEAGWKTQQGL